MYQCINVCNRVVTVNEISVGCRRTQQWVRAAAAAHGMVVPQQLLRMYVRTELFDFVLNLVDRWKTRQPRCWIARRRVKKAVCTGGSGEDEGEGGHVTHLAHLFQIRRYFSKYYSVLAIHPRVVVPFTRGHCIAAVWSLPSSALLVPSLALLANHLDCSDAVEAQC